MGEHPECFMYVYCKSREMAYLQITMQYTCECLNMNVHDINLSE